MNCTINEVFWHIEKQPELRQSVDVLCGSYLEITPTFYTNDEITPVLEASFHRNMSAYMRDTVAKLSAEGKRKGMIPLDEMLKEVFRRVSDDVNNDAQLKSNLLSAILLGLAKNADSWEQFTDDVINRVEMSQKFVDEKNLPSSELLPSIAE